MTDAYTAVLDRIVDGETAVFLLEAEGRVVDELTVDVDRVPEDGRHDGAVFDVVVADGKLLEASYRPEETDARREAAQERFDRLSRRLGDDEG